MRKYSTIAGIQSSWVHESRPLLPFYIPQTCLQNDHHQPSPHLFLKTKFILHDLNLLLYYGNVPRPFPHDDVTTSFPIRITSPLHTPPMKTGSAHYYYDYSYYVNSEARTIIHPIPSSYLRGVEGAY